MTTGNGHGDFQLHARGGEQFTGALGIEIIPDGVNLIVFAYVGTRKFELTLERQELKDLANYLLQAASR
jgi:hypothetical protein